MRTDVKEGIKSGEWMNGRMVRVGNVIEREKKGKRKAGNKVMPKVKRHFSPAFPFFLYSFLFRVYSHTLSTTHVYIVYREQRAEQSVKAFTLTKWISQQETLPPALLGILCV
jgi:hypothetical protein